MKRRAAWAHLAFLSLLSCERMSAYSIGVDLGGTNLRAAAIAENGDLLDKISGSTPIEAGPDAAIADIVSSIRSLHARRANAQLAGVGVGVPGFIRMETGVIAGWGNRPA